MEDMVDHEMESNVKPAHGGQTDDESTSVVHEESDEDEEFRDPQANIEVTSYHTMNNQFMITLPPQICTCSLICFIINVFQNQCFYRKTATILTVMLRVQV
jgi:hypothetical protein